MSKRKPSENVLDLVLAVQELPTVSVIASQLLALTARKEATLTDIATLVSRDVGLSAKILRVANSSVYGFPRQIVSIHQAMSLIGISAVRSLVLSFSLFDSKGERQYQCFDCNGFWERSLVSAAAAKWILGQVRTTDSEDAFLCGLLQDIGQLVFASALEAEYDHFLREMQGRGGSNVAGLMAMEQEWFGFDHSMVGYAVAQHWGFPEHLLVAIRYHHAPRAYKGGNTKQYQTLSAVYLSGLLTHIFYSSTPESYHRQLCTEAKELLGLTGLNIDTILDQIDKEIHQLPQGFGVTINPVKSVAEILQEANLRLSVINQSYEAINRELITSKMALEKLSEDLAQKNRWLENLANVDGLTEINNYRFFQNFLDAEINRSVRNQRALSLLLVDIDRFKQFNDTYGHQTGDFILKEFSRVAKSIVREYDLIARYGGEEFVVVLPETDVEEAMVVAEKIRKTIEAYTFDDGTETYHVTISIGAASARPTRDDFKKDDLIGFADKALYEAKNSGRNRAIMGNSQTKKKWCTL